MCSVLVIFNTNVHLCMHLHVCGRQIHVSLRMERCQGTATRVMVTTIETIKQYYEDYYAGFLQYVLLFIFIFSECLQVPALENLHTVLFQDAPLVIVSGSNSTAAALCGDLHAINFSRASM